MSQMDELGRSGYSILQQMRRQVRQHMRRSGNIELVASMPKNNG
jgi:hypothetical protein